MFLKDLNEESQKTLFLELAALIMMAEGDEATTSQKIKEVNLDNKSYVFFQNIDENEIKALTEYSEAFGRYTFDDLFSVKSIRTSISFGSTFGSANKNYEYDLRSILEEQADLALEEYSQLEDFKKEVMLRIISNGEDVLNINSAMVEKFMLSTSIIRRDILKRTVKELIAIRQETIDNFKSKEKKIILFELIGAGYSSGHFGDDEKSLLIYICELLKIENEYVEEFLEVSEKLFTIKKELAILINE